MDQHASQLGLDEGMSPPDLPKRLNFLTEQDCDRRLEDGVIAAISAVVEAPVGEPARGPRLSSALTRYTFGISWSIVGLSVARCNDGCTIRHTYSSVCLAAPGYYQLIPSPRTRYERISYLPGCSTGNWPLSTSRSSGFTRVFSGIRTTLWVRTDS